MIDRDGVPVLSHEPGSSFIERSLILTDIKYVADFMLASLGLFLLGPLLMIAALAIWIDSKGPIIFKQTRTGFKGKKFQIYKFRTMSVLENGPNVQQAVQGDARVTRVGYWLRRTSIDELPQLINVIRGEMSLVGPRPHALAHDIFYTQHISNYMSRFAVKPGITGWAQVNGSRGATPTIADMKRRVDLDLWYVRNWTPLLDFKIIARTITEEMKQGGLGQ